MHLSDLFSFAEPLLDFAHDAELVALGGDVNFFLLEASHSHFDGVVVVREFDDVVGG
jgi:hypothetical protein